MKNSASPPELRIGVDTGGTFTDFIAILGAHRIAFKVPSTPAAPADAILDGVRRVLALTEFASSTTASQVLLDIAHGTTVATNALLERKGARTALITTAGFEDVIEIGRQARPDLYNLNVLRQPPLVPGELRFGVEERIGPDGSVITRLHNKELTRLKRELTNARVESVAISLLFSFANPSHEKVIADALHKLELPVSVSHEILPEYREYERTSTVVVNAYLAPRVGDYLRSLAAGLDNSQLGSIPARLRIMQSSGGSISAEVAAREPVRTILSGPAGGVVSSLKIAEMGGISDIITFDMGGTSTDVSLCRGGARTTNESQLAGLPVAVPVLDIHTVGAGGGSIARVDEGGALRVGPQSAGAVPGPACYGRGNFPTVTDANLILGRFGGEGLLAGAMQLDVSRAAQVIDRLAAEMSAASHRRVTRVDAALGVIRVANINMEQALRLVSTERGHDPRRFTLISFGGAGGLHAGALAEALRIPRILVPLDPGNFSALGVLLADVVRDYSQTIMTTLPAGKVPGAGIAKAFASLEQKATYDLSLEGFTGAKVQMEHSVAARYRGQSFELEIPWERDLVASFHRVHRERYGHGDETSDIEIVNVRLRAAGLTSKPRIPRARKRKSLGEPKGETRLWLTSRATVAPVYDRGALHPGAIVSGPSIIVEYGSTTLVPPGWSSEVDAFRNLVLQKAGGEGRRRLTR